MCIQCIHSKRVFAQPCVSEACQACWCTETQKSKQAAIEEGSARIESLAAEIEQGIALSARLGPEIESLQKEAEKNQQALQQATAIREKQVSEFEAESKDLQESISAVRKAVKAGKSKSFLQTSSRNAALAFAKSRRQGGICSICIDGICQCYFLLSKINK